LVDDWKFNVYALQFVGVDCAVFIEIDRDACTRNFNSVPADVAGFMKNGKLIGRSAFVDISDTFACWPKPKA
jgi:hypothetical protein